MASVALGATEASRSASSRGIALSYHDTSPPATDQDREAAASARPRWSKKPQRPRVAWPTPPRPPPRPSPWAVTHERDEGRGLRRARDRGRDRNRDAGRPWPRPWL